MREFRELIDLIATTPFERAEEEWCQVLTRLALPLFYQPALAVAFAKTKWREARDVGRYLRSATIRQAQRLGLADRPGPVPVSDLLPGEQTHDQFVDRQAQWCDDETDDIYDRVADEFIAPDCLGEMRVDWDRVGKWAGLDDDEIYVLECRSDGLTRTQILEEVAENERERLRLQAAYRSVHKRRPEIAATLRGDFPQKPKGRVRRK